MATPTNSLLKRIGSLGLGLALLGSASLSIISCKKDSTTEVDQDAVANVKVATSATLGPYLTDAAGNTLYIFARDVDGPTPVPAPPACPCGPCITRPISKSPSR